MKQAWQQWLDAMRSEWPSWIFIGKALLALYLACWIAMRLEMPSPSTVMITVLIVMNPSTGMVLAKAFYRIFGTIFGCVAGVALVALFPQQPILLLLGMAIWTACMAAGALLNRNMRAYSFVLGGYTVAMIVLPSVNQPEMVFETAIWRFVEVGLGLIVASCVFDVLLPNRLHAPLNAAGQASYEKLMAYIKHLGTQQQWHKVDIDAQQSLVKASIGYEDLRTLAYFDDPSIRANNGALAELNQRYMQAVSRLLVLQHFLKRHTKASVLAPELAPIQTVLNELTALLQNESATWNELLADLTLWQRTTEMQFKPMALAAEKASAELVIGQSLLARFSDALLVYLNRLIHLDIDKPSALTRAQKKAVSFARATDPMAVASTMLRAGGVMFLIGWIWIASGWQSGGTALFGIVALLSMLSAAPNPVSVTKLVTLGHIIAPLIGLVCYSLLPILPTFPLLVLGTLPFMLVILYVGTRPGLAPLGMALNMGFMVALSLPLVPNINPQFYLNEAVAISVGVTIALLSFIIVPTVAGTAGQRRRLMNMLRKQIRTVVQAPLSGLAAKFESRTYDILGQVMAMTGASSLAARRLQDWTLIVQETGLIILDIRTELLAEYIPETVRKPINALLNSLAQLEGEAAARHWHLARQRAQQVLRLMPVNDECFMSLRQSLLQLDNVLGAGDSIAARRVKLKRELQYAA